jgi:hypothetical protein
MVNGMYTGITPTLPKTNYMKIFKKKALMNLGVGSLAGFFRTPVES